MDDLTKLVLPAALALFGGVIVFVVGQLLGKFIIDPLHEVKKLLSEIQFSILFHAHALMTPVGDRQAEDRAMESFRRLSLDLHTKVSSVPFYGPWSAVSCGFWPKRGDALAAAKFLMALSNSVHQAERSEKN